MQPVLAEAVDHDGEEHQQRERHRDDDVARHRERIGDQPDHVDGQHEHEEREHEREEFHPLAAGAAAQRRRDELVGHFRDRLQAPGHERARRRGADRQEQDDRKRDEHEQRRIGQRDLVAAEMARSVKMFVI